MWLLPIPALRLASSSPPPRALLSPGSRFPGSSALPLKRRTPGRRPTGRTSAQCRLHSPSCATSPCPIPCGMGSGPRTRPSSATIWTTPFPPSRAPPWRDPQLQSLFPVPRRPRAGLALGMGRGSSCHRSATSVPRRAPPRPGPSPGQGRYPLPPGLAVSPSLLLPHGDRVGVGSQLLASRLPAVLGRRSSAGLWYRFGSFSFRSSYLHVECSYQPALELG